MPPKEMKMMPADVGQNRQQAGRQHEVGGRRAGRVLVAEPIKLVVIAALPLNTVTHVARSQDERNNQHDGVEVVAHHSDEAETPNGGQRSGDDRRPPAAALADRQPQDEDHRRRRRPETAGRQVFVVVTVAADDRLAGNEDLVVVILILVDDRLDSREQLLCSRDPVR